MITHVKFKKYVFDLREVALAWLKVYVIFVLLGLVGGSQDTISLLLGVAFFSSIGVPLGILYQINVGNLDPKIGKKVE